MSAVAESLRRRAAAQPHAPALRGSRASVGCAELLERAERCAATLDAHGVRVAALLEQNGPDWVVADLGALIAGVTLVPIPEFFSAGQRRHVLETSGADALIARGALDGVSCIEVERLGRELRLYHVASAGAAWPPERRRGPAKISFTSGTTGEPKGVGLRLGALEAVAASLHAVTRDLDIGRHLCVLPLPTLLENVAGVYAPLLSGAEVVVPDPDETGLCGAAGLDVARLLRTIDAYRPNSIILVPQILAALVDALEAGARAAASLRFVAVGGAHVSAALLRRAQRAGLPVYEGYGLTECASVVAMSAPGASRAGSVGRPLPHVRVRVDETGEIVVASATEGPGEASGAGEIRTGDLGRIDADGYLYIVGRRKNVFITSFGRNVSPEWVEAELARSRHIRQAALFGEARPWNVAVIVASPAARAGDLAAAVARANAELPDYARVGAWIPADEPFSLRNGLATANGRLRRDAILAAYAPRIDLCYERSLTESPRREA